MPYSKVQLIAFNIRPDTEKSSAKESYMGASKAADDIAARCDVMKAAIREAYKLVTAAESKWKRAVPKRGPTTSTIDDTKPLKVFMAPEFFFRGAEGAYPIDQVSLIMDKMKEETDKAEPSNPPNETYDYSDWLFVFGTVIGYLRHDQVDATVKNVRKDLDGKTIVTVDSVPEGPRENLLVVGKAQGRITAIAMPAQDRAEVTVAPSVGFAAGWTANTTGPDTSTGGPFVIAAVSGGKLTLDAKQGVCGLESCPCVDHFMWSRVPCPRCKHWHLKFDVGAAISAEIRAKVLTVTEAAAGPAISVQDPQGQTTHRRQAPKRFELKLDTTASFQVGDTVSVERADKGVSEIWNVALVRKGGQPKPGSTGVRETAVYKEYVSHIDYIRPKGGVPGWGEAAGRTITLHGSDVTVMPTSGSRDLLGADPNLPGTEKDWTDKDSKIHKQRISEINVKGGGGSVFTIDDVTFGLEVCLDHARNRLYAYYSDHYVCPTCKEVSPQSGDCRRHPQPYPKRVAEAKAAAPGDPKVQVHLIPSWGMTIGGGEVCCLDGGVVFNVDGARCDSTAREQNGSYACDDHPTVNATAAGSCSGGHFVCIPCKRPWTDAQLRSGKCPICKKTVNAYPVDLKRMGALIAKKTTQAVDLSKARSDWGKYFRDGSWCKPRIDIYEPRGIPPAEKVT